MDLLGSILNSMDKPPSVSDKQRMMMKKQKEAFLQRQKEEKEKLQAFREKIEAKINEFIQDEKVHKYTFAPMEQVYRSIIRDVTEVAGLLAYSFGEEGVDRHIVIFKKESTPCEDELAALRRGEEWTPEMAKELAEKREQEKKLMEEESKSKPKEFVPNSNYKEKYEHLIGKDSALAAARKTETNRQYGFVPSENKRDHRSIEQTLADIKAKKKLKTQENAEVEK